MIATMQVVPLAKSKTEKLRKLRKILKETPSVRTEGLPLLRAKREINYIINY